MERNRKAFYDTIPKIILATKSLFDNKVNNQINLFDENSSKLKRSMIQSNTADWSFEDKLSKEFESIGFFISDHPVNQYREFFRYLQNTKLQYCLLIQLYR